MTQGNMIYLGLCVRYQPPIIGVHYKNKQTDEKKKVYTILLQRLILNPNPMQVAQQLYLQHPHILKPNKIAKEKIAALVQKIQKQLRIGDQYDEEEEHEEDYDEQYEHEEEHQEEQDENGQHQEQEEQHHEEPKRQPEPPQVPQKKRPKFDFDKDFGRDDGPLNRSL